MAGENKTQCKSKASEIFGAEVPADSFNPTTHTIAAIKVGTVAHTPFGDTFECTADWMEVHANDWTNGALIANHNGADSEKFGIILKSWFEYPFINMTVGNMNEEAEQRMMNGEHTGFSFDARGFLEDPTGVQGTDLSILFYPHTPACPLSEGCGLTAEDPTESNSQNVINTDIQNSQIGSEYMPEKTYTDAEIASMKADSAQVATLMAEAQVFGAEKAALKAEIAERTGKITDLMAEKEALFTTEGVEAKVSAVQETMFSAEDMEAAKKTAVEEAIAAEAERSAYIAAETDAINRMYPEGLDAEFKTEIMAMVADGKSHDVLVKLGTGVEYKTLIPSVPAAVGETTVAAEADPFAARVEKAGIPEITFGGN